MDDQDAVIALLGTPSTYGETEPVQIVKTHASLVFLTADRAFKLKRAVRYSFLDYSTIDARRQACEAELEFNRRTAPELYLGTQPITRNAEGTLALGGDGDPVDWVVVMRRFDADCLLDRVAESGRFDRTLAFAVADEIARFHADAAPLPVTDGAARIGAVLEQIIGDLQRFAAAHGASIARWASAAQTYFATVRPVLDWRAAAGKIRHCHGDLHLRNICLLDGKPTLFDAIEFSAAIYQIDILYDLAFLLMDLENRALGEAANTVFNRYFDRSEETDGLAALPLFMSLRAAVRAFVQLTLGTDEAVAEGARYLGLAAELLTPRAAALVAVGGLSGTGKSSLAYTLAPLVGRAPGARVLRSDVHRKRLSGLDPETPLPETAYTPDSSRQVYAELERLAKDVLSQGQAAIIDAVFAQQNERDGVSSIAATKGLAFVGLWLEAPHDVRAERVTQRRHDASDASAEIVARQAKWQIGALSWHILDAGGSTAASRDAALKIVGAAIPLVANGHAAHA